jgi:hypothetical protein
MFWDSKLDAPTADTLFNGSAVAGAVLEYFIYHGFK